MLNSDKIEQQSDSLIDLLTAQCTDLEKLLNLAREETLAVRHGNFGRMLEIVSERDKIGQRLETFQQQISELRGELEQRTVHPDLAAKIIETTNLTLAQDQKTRLLLEGRRQETARELKDLDRFQKGTEAYLKERTRGLAYSRTV